MMATPPDPIRERIQRAIHSIDKLDDVSQKAADYDPSLAASLRSELNSDSLKFYPNPKYIRETRTSSTYIGTNVPDGRLWVVTQITERNDNRSTQSILSIVNAAVERCTLSPAVAVGVGYPVQVLATPLILAPREKLVITDAAHVAGDPHTLYIRYFEVEI